MNAAKVTLTATVLAAALGLALVFSVSSAEAQKLCEPCQKCDKDGDSLIQNRPFCINKCDGPIDDDDSDAGMCSVDDVVFSLFEVTLTGPVSGGPNFFNGSTSDGRFINLPTFNPQGMALDLSFFADMDGGSFCFPDPGPTTLFAALIESKNVKGSGALQAIGKFWFDAETTSDPDDDIVVSYVLQLFGTFSNNDTWHGDNELTMTDWNMKVETTSKGGRKIACTSEGLFSDKSVYDVMIDVVQTQ